MDYKALPPAELVLQCLRTGEESAWIEFVRRFQPLIGSVVIRVARQWGETSRAAIDDLIQETYLKLCANRFGLIQKFKSRHEDAIYGYIKVFTANLVHDHFKAFRAQKRGGDVETASINDGRSGDCSGRKEPAEVLVERRLLLGKVAAFLVVLTSGQNADRDRRIFWLYYRAGLSASAIATLPSIGLSTKGVESIIQRLTRAVRQELVAPKHDDLSTGKAVEGIRPTESL